jgi:hypothetical protein
MVVVLVMVLLLLLRLGKVPPSTAAVAVAALPRE